MEIRGTFSTTTSLLTSSTSSPSWWSDPFIQEMAFDDNNISDQSKIGLRSLQLDPPNTHLQKRHPGRTLDMLKFKNIFCHSCGADNFYTPPSRSSGPQFFCRCRFCLQCFDHLTPPDSKTFFPLHLKTDYQFWFATPRLLECLFWACPTSRTGWTDTGCPTESSLAG